MTEGISAASMERIAREAGVSKSLVYAYFDDQVALLQALLVREHQRLQRRQLQDAKRAGGFEALAGAMQRDHWEYALERGPFIERLMSEPAVAAAMESVVLDERAAVTEFLTRHVVRNFAIPERIATMSVMLLLGLEKEAAGGDLPGSLDEFEDLWGAMIVGALRELERRYAADG